MVDLGNGKKGLRATLPHFSSYGFALPPPPAPEPDPPSPPDFNGPDDNPNCPDNDCGAGSLINTISGELSQSVGTLGLPSAGGLPTQVTARYHSLDLSSTSVITADLKIKPGSPFPIFIGWAFEIAGRTFQGDYSDKVNIRWDGRDADGRLLPPGFYQGKLTAVYAYPTSCPVANCIALPIVFRFEIPWPVKINRPDISPFGLGWFGSHDTLLVDSGPLATILQADGRYVAFTRVGSDYQAQNGEFSSLLHNGDGTWTRTFRDGARQEFNADGRLARVEDRYGNFQAILYESNGKFFANGTWGLTTRIRQVTDTSGNTFDFAYDGNGWLASITDNSGRVYPFAHDAAGHLTSASDPLGQAESFTYDGRGMMTSHTDRRNAKTTYVLDDQGRLVSRTWPTNTTLQMSYARRQTSLLTDRGTSFITSLDAYYDPIAVYNGVYTKTSTYNGDFLSESTTFPPETNLYDANGNLVERLAGTQTSLERGGPYDQVSRLVSSSGQDAAASYDSAGNLVSFSDALGQEYSLAYDSAGQPLQITDPLGHTISLAYDSRGLLTSFKDALNDTYQVTYDAAGNPTHVSDPQNKGSTYEYDALNRLVAFVDALNGRSEVAYDANSNLTSYTDPSGRSVSYSYDAVNRLTGITYPDGGKEQFGYDANGALNRLTEARGKVTTWQYDSANRPVQKQVQGGPTVIYQYDNLDLLTGLEDGTLSTSLDYVPDTEGLLLRERQTSPTLPVSMTLTYDYGQASLASLLPTSAAALASADQAAIADLPAPGDILPPEDSLAPEDLPGPEQAVVTDTIPQTTGPEPSPAAGPYYEIQVAGQPGIGPNTNVGGTIITNTTWTKAGSPYIATSSVTVASGVTLTVEPGVEVQFNQSFGLLVNGALLAVGTPAEPILFTGTSAKLAGGPASAWRPFRLPTR